MRCRKSGWARLIVGVTLLSVVGCAERTPPEPEAEAPPPLLGLEYTPPAPGTYELPPIQNAADGVVLDADGTQRRLFDYMGDRHVLLSFVYTRCTDSKGCPLATAMLQLVDRALEEEPELARSVRLVTLTFDPVRDTPETMRDYASHADRDYVGTPWDERPWVFLTTSSVDEVQPILDGYGQYIVPELDESGNPTGDFTHVLKLYLIDTERRVRNIYSSGFIHPATTINDLKTLLMEEAGD